MIYDIFSKDDADYITKIRSKQTVTTEEKYCGIPNFVDFLGKGNP